MSRATKTPSPAQRLRPRLATNRRGTAAFVVILLIGVMAAGSFLALAQVRTSLLVVGVGQDQAKAQEVAHACAAGSVKALPVMLNTMLLLMALEDPNLHASEMFAEQFDYEFFGEDPYGTTNQVPWCQCSLVDIQDDIPPAGWSERGGCFKRVTLDCTGEISRPSTGSSDPTQTQVATTREVVVRGLFGPTTCN